VLAFIQLILVCVILHFNGTFVGLQEYIEAVALWHFVTERNIISLQDVQQRLTFTQAGFTV